MTISVYWPKSNSNWAILYHFMSCLKVNNDWPLLWSLEYFCRCLKKVIPLPLLLAKNIIHIIFISYYILMTLSCLAILSTKIIFDKNLFEWTNFHLPECLEYYGWDIYLSPLNFYNLISKHIDGFRSHTCDNADNSVLLWKRTRCQHSIFYHFISAQLFERAQLDQPNWELEHHQLLAFVSYRLIWLIMSKRYATLVQPFQLLSLCNSYCASQR